MEQQLMQLLAAIERVVSSQQPSGLKGMVQVNSEALDVMDKAADEVRENLREIDEIVGDSEEEYTLG